MAKKKVNKRSVRRQAPQRSQKAQPSASKNAPKETVRVKTYIVEKPVYIQAPPQKIFSRPEPEEEEQSFDSRRSRYLKRREEREISKKKLPEEDEFGEGEYADEGMPQEKAQKGRKAPAEDDEFPANVETDDLGEEPLPEDELTAGEEGEALDEGYAEGQEEAPGVKTHVRSHGMFTNIWWKKAIIWAVFAWLIILGVEMGMQAMKLIEVDLTRQWWVLLGILIAISIVYQKFLTGKIKI